MGMGWGGPGTVCAEGTLVGQLKLKWVQTRVSTGVPCRGARAAKVGTGLGNPGMLRAWDHLTSPLEPKQMGAWRSPGHSAPKLP